MIKLLVTSTLIMSEEDLWWYAARNSERAKNLKPEEFIRKIKSGERIVVKFPDETITSYELIEQKN